MGFGGFLSFCFWALRRTLLLLITFAIWGLFLIGLVFWVGIDEGKSFVQGFKKISKGLSGGATFGFFPSLLRYVVVACAFVFVLSKEQGGGNDTLQHNVG